MEIQIIGLLVLMLIVLLLLFLEALSADIIAIGLLTLLWVLGYVDSREALSGFSNKAVLTVACMYVLSRALVKTGMPEFLVQRFSRMAGRKKWIGLGAFLVSVSLFSGFINNVAAVAIFIPIAMQLSARFRISPSKLMIPLSYAAIYGGTLTLIGTSTNLLVSAISEDHAQPPLGMFEFFQLGIIFLLVGTVYNLVLLPKILPDRAGDASLVNKYNMGSYLTEFMVGDLSPLINSTCKRRKISETYDVTILSIIRGDDRFNTNLGNIELQAGDILYTRGTLDSFMEFREKEKVLSLTDVKINERDLRGEENNLVEGIIPAVSSLIGKSLKEINFRSMFGAFVLAIGRQGSSLRKRVAHIQLKFSDTLLMLVPQSRFSALADSPDLIILQRHDIHLHKHRLWWLAIAAIPVIMISAALGIIDILAGALTGMCLLFITRNISTHEAYRAVNWQVIIFIAAFIPFGIAMDKSGASQIIGMTIMQIGDLFPAGIAPYAVLTFLYLVTSLLTEILSNNAAAILLTPIAIATANGLGVDPRPFIFSICFAASASFMTPIGYKTNLMVYSPGKYRFTDYLRAGAPLNMLFWILASLLIPRFWSF